MTNAELVSYFYQVLNHLNVSEIIVCAGARNAPLVVGLDHQNFKITSYFEERSAGFNALGKIKASNKPVAIMTTSGTAVAELLPAVIEGYYQGLPLIVISADRPKSYRGSGAPQSIDQPGIFNNYVSQCYDWDVNESNLKVEFDLQKPLHFNLCFDEPLIDGNFDLVSQKMVDVVSTRPVQKTSVEAVNFSSQKKFEKPLIILSQLSQTEKIKVKKLILQYQLYHYAETLSGLIGDPELLHLQINNCEPMFGSFLEKNVFSSVIRIGGIPTLRLWRDLEKKFSCIPVLSITDLSFSGLARQSTVVSFENIEHFLNCDNNKSVDLISLNQKLQNKKVETLLNFKNSEQNFIFQLSDLIKTQPIYIGNSLPIREWDQFSQGLFSDTYGNRGANGIDGQISTYLGWSDQFKMSWAIVGDLTAMYDLAALGLDRSAAKFSKKNVVIINNQGGQIFKKIFNHEKFLNPHEINFQGWAQMFGWNYLQISDISELVLVQQVIAKNEIKNFVIEIKTDQKQSDAVWKIMDESCKNVIF